MAELLSRRRPSAFTRRRLHPTRDSQGRLLTSPAASPDSSASLSASPPGASSLHPAAPSSLEQLYRDDDEGTSLLFDRSISKSLDRALLESRTPRNPPLPHEDEISLSVGALRRETRGLLPTSDCGKSPRDASFYSAMMKLSPENMSQDGQPGLIPSLHATPRNGSVLRNRSSFFTPTEHSSGPCIASNVESPSKVSRNTSSSLRSPRQNNSSTSSTSNSEEKMTDGPDTRPAEFLSPSSHVQPPLQSFSPDKRSYSSGKYDSEAKQTNETHRDQYPAGSSHNHEASLAAQIALPPSPKPETATTPACDSILSDSDLSLRPDKTAPCSSSPLPTTRFLSSSSGPKQWGAAPIASPNPSTAISGYSRILQRGSTSSRGGIPPTLASRPMPGREAARMSSEKREPDLRRQLGRKAFSRKATSETEVSQTTYESLRDPCLSALHEVLGLAHDLEQAHVVGTRNSLTAGDPTGPHQTQPAKFSVDAARSLQSLVEAAREAQAAYVGEKEQLLSQLEMEVKKGDTLAEALAHAEMDTDRRLLLAREQARSEARQSVQALLDKPSREDLDALTQALDQRDAARSAIGRAVELAEKADAERVRMRDEMRRAEKERDDVIAQMKTLEQRLVSAERTQAEVERAEARAKSAERIAFQVQEEIEAVKHREAEQAEAWARFQASLDEVTQERDDALHRLDEQESLAENFGDDLVSIQAILDSSRARAEKSKYPLRRETVGGVFAQAEETVPKEMVLEENRRLQELLEMQDTELNQLRRTGGLRYVVPSSSISKGPTTIRRYDDPLHMIGCAHDSPTIASRRSSQGKME